MAFAASADTTTAAVSARRSNAVTGNNTCVTPQPVHRDRRGHSCTGPCGPRNCRGRARPQPASTRAACRAAQLTGRQPALDLIDICFYGDHCASEREQTALPQHSGQETTGGPSPTNDLITVPPRHHEQQTGIQQADTLLTVSAGPLPPRAHPECPRTLKVSATKLAIPSWTMPSSSSEQTRCPARTVP